jgi:hypothetical protein
MSIELVISHPYSSRYTTRIPLMPTAAPTIYLLIMNPSPSQTNINPLKVWLLGTLLNAINYTISINSWGIRVLARNL